jgi:MYXO-CTERM domain-containing protein
MRAALSALLIIPVVAFAESDGITGYSAKQGAAVTCRACHTLGNVPSGTISNAPISLPVLTTANVTVTITASSVASTIAGINVALAGAGSDGASLIAGAGTQIEAGELTHTAPQRFDGGQAVWTFGVRAGGTNGPLTIYITSLAADGNNANTNDAPYSFNRTITVVGDAGHDPPPVDSGVIIDPDSGVVIIPDAGSDAGPSVNGPPGGFVGGDYGCSTGSGMTSGLWLLALGLLGLGLQRRRLR